MYVPLVFLAAHAAPHTLHFGRQSSRIPLSGTAVSGQERTYRLAKMRAKADIQAGRRDRQ
jgi:hypothetical protein